MTSEQLIVTPKKNELEKAAIEIYNQNPGLLKLWEKNAAEGDIHSQKLVAIIRSYLNIV